MLQNETEMFNVDLGGNARYFNGHLQLVSNMAAKKESKNKKFKIINKKNEFTFSTTPDRKPKFSDRLKSLLHNNSIHLENGLDTDDPYTFSEPEPQVLRLYKNWGPNNTYSKKNLSTPPKVYNVSSNISKNVKPLVIKTENDVSKKNLTPVIVTKTETGKIAGNITLTSTRLDMGKSAKNSLPVVTGSDAHSVESIRSIICAPTTVSSSKVSTPVSTTGDKRNVDECSKTMNRLQARIAQNKVIGKHKKVNNVRESVDICKQVTPQPHRERSLLEEQLLGIKSESIIEDEPKSPPIVSSPKSSRPAPAVKRSYTDVIAIPPKKRCRRPRSISKETCDNNSALQRLRILHERCQYYDHDLFSLGLEPSESEESDLEDSEVFQKYWFSGWGEPGVCIEGRREGKLGLIKSELHRRLKQKTRGLKHIQKCDAYTETVLEAACEHPRKTGSFLQRIGKNYQPVLPNRCDTVLLQKRTCTYKAGESDACNNLALPCTQHCVRHIMYNVDQLLFEHCTAKFSDNTQCCVPVFDITHELPLCLEHARKRDNYDKMNTDVKPRTVRRKTKPPALRRPGKRGKKKKRVQKVSEHFNGSMDTTSMDTGLSDDVTDVIVEASPDESSIEAPSLNTDVPSLNVNMSSLNPDVTSLNVDVTSLNVDVTSLNVDVTSLNDDVTSLNVNLPSLNNSLPVTNGFCVNTEGPHLDEQETEAALEITEDLPLDTEDLSGPKLLENLEQVIDMMPPEALNELFSGDKNGQYLQPTKEETEELERALEAVDEDVKSLEKLTQTQGLLQTFIDEHAFVQTLTQLPDVSTIMPAFTSYHNGFVVDPHASSFYQYKNVLHHPGLILDAPPLTIHPQTDMPS